MGKALINYRPYLKSIIYGGLVKGLILDKLNNEGLMQFLTVCKHLAFYFQLPVHDNIRDVTAITDVNCFALSSQTAQTTIEQGRVITFKLDKKEDYLIDSNSYFVVTWDKQNMNGKKEGFFEALTNEVKKYDLDQWDRSFSFPDTGTYKITADIYLANAAKEMKRYGICRILIN
jgi:hypothetical protein